MQIYLKENFASVFFVLGNLNSLVAADNLRIYFFGQLLSEMENSLPPLPYFDFSGLGVVITAAVPMYMNKGVSKNQTSLLQDQERYFGVAGIDLAVADIFKDLADAKNHGKKSFGFLIDFSGRVLYHPSLPSPEDKNGKNPKFVDIKDLMQYLFSLYCFIIFLLIIQIYYLFSLR